MGLLEKLGFERKDCVNCGEKLNVMGNAKLKDGSKICKSCLSLKSPYLTGIGNMTLEQYREHLAYREENKVRADEFNTTHYLSGSNVNLYIDYDKREFVITGNSAWKQANVDVMFFDEIVDVDFEIKENKTEEKTKDENGNSISFNPPRYKYTYDFRIYITLNNKWWSQITYKLNSFSVEGYNNELYDSLYMETEEFVEILSMLKTCSREELEETLEYYKQWKAEPTKFDSHYYYEDRNYARSGDFYSHRDPRTKHADFKYVYRK